jgi:hypothetical protein
MGKPTTDRKLAMIIIAKDRMLALALSRNC